VILRRILRREDLDLEKTVVLVDFKAITRRHDLRNNVRHVHLADD